ACYSPRWRSTHVPHGKAETARALLKAIDAKTGKELYKFKTPSGIIGNVTTYEHSGKQYVAVLSGVGGWAGIGLAAGLTEPTAGLGAGGGYAGLREYTSLGGQLTVFALPGSVCALGAFLLPISDLR